MRFGKKVGRLREWNHVSLKTNVSHLIPSLSVEALASVTESDLRYSPSEIRKGPNVFIFDSACRQKWMGNIIIRRGDKGLPCGPVVKNPPSNAGD